MDKRKIYVGLRTMVSPARRLETDIVVCCYVPSFSSHYTIKALSWSNFKFLKFQDIDLVGSVTEKIGRVARVQLSESRGTYIDQYSRWINHLAQANNGELDFFPLEMELGPALQPYQADFLKREAARIASATRPTA